MDIVTAILSRAPLTEIVKDYNEYFDEPATLETIVESLHSQSEHSLMMFASYNNLIPNYL